MIFLSAISSAGKTGGFIISSEAYYTSSRGGDWNRWNNLYGSPYMRSYDYYYYSPYSYNNYWGNRWNSGQSVRYQADNIAILSFDKNGKREWSSVITKEQFDDQIRRSAILPDNEYRWTVTFFI